MMVFLKEFSKKLILKNISRLQLLSAFFKINFFKKFFQEHYQCISLDPDQDHLFDKNHDG